MSAPRRGILPLFIPHLGCPHDCVFCSQRSIAGQARPVTPAEVEAALSALARPVEELAFYGGSFTALPEAEQEALLAAAQPFLRAGTVGALRVSTRPDAIDPARLALLRRYGVRTVELGAQSMDDGVLAASGRGHTAADTERAAALVKRKGFQLILQMMTGLPGSSDETDYATGERLAALKPGGVRIYPTVILKDTPLYELWRRGAYREHGVEDAVRVCARLLPLFEQAGIPVIRLGLNPTDELSRGDAVAGGAYHPALGELVKSRVWLERARAFLSASGAREDVTLGVNKSAVSQMTGQHRGNLNQLREEFSLRSLKIVPAPVPMGEIVLMENGRSETE